MNFTFFLNALFNSKNAGAVEIAVNANALDSAIANGGSATEIVLGVAEVALGISQYFNSNVASKIGVVGVDTAQLNNCFK